MLLLKQLMYERKSEFVSQYLHICLDVSLHAQQSKTWNQIVIFIHSFSLLLVHSGLSQCFQSTSVQHRGFWCLRGKNSKWWAKVKWLFSKCDIGMSFHHSFRFFFSALCNNIRKKVKKHARTSHSRTVILEGLPEIIKNSYNNNDNNDDIL